MEAPFPNVVTARQVPMNTQSLFRVKLTGAFDAMMTA
jgi:hypothetical protein